MTPGFKFLGVVFIVALLAIAFTNGAHAEPAPMNEACVGAMAPEVGAVYDVLEAGMEPAVARYLVVTTEGYGDAGRWLLVSFIDAWEIADEFGIHHTRAKAIEITMELCRIPPGQLADPTAGNPGAVRPLKGVEI